MAGSTRSPGTLVGTGINRKISSVFPKIRRLPSHKLVAHVALGREAALGVGWILGVLIIRQVALLALKRYLLESLGKTFPMATQAIQLLMPSTPHENGVAMCDAHVQHQPIFRRVAPLAILRKAALMHIRVAILAKRAGLGEIFQGMALPAGEGLVRSHQGKSGLCMVKDDGCPVFRYMAPFTIGYRSIMRCIPGLGSNRQN